MQWYRFQILICSAALLVAGCDPFHTTFDDVESAIEYEAAETDSDPLASPDEVLVMTWNIKFGGGRIEFFFGCHDDRVLMTEEEVYDNLDGVVRKIKQVDPDVLLLQEVDVSAKRSAYVDQLQYVLDHTGLNYGAYASQWRADYVPSDGIGPVDSGSAILSRWPIENGTRYALPLIGDQSAVKRYFWLRRNILIADVVVPGFGPLAVANTHTAAFSNDGTKREQLEIFKEKLDAIDADGRVFVAGGDLNTLPPGSKKVDDFPDQVCEGNDFESAGDKRAEFAWMEPLLDTYQAAIPTETFAEDNERYFTFTSDKDGFWNRKLDYMFTNASFEESLVHQSVARGGLATMPLSDHAPMTAELALP